jgi:transketolase
MTEPADSQIDCAALEAIARRIRHDVVRIVAPTGQGYVQQGLGAADLFTALYFRELRLDASNPLWPGRDRFILSTAHNSAVFHATLAHRGLIDTARLDTYCKDGSTLEINVSERLGPLVCATCGSLGQGLSVGIGMALAARHRGADTRIHVVLGDGELQEGQLWEAAMSAASFGLDPLCMTIDLNRMQVEGDTDRVVRMGSIAAKFDAFGWDVQEIDGNDMAALMAAYDHARSVQGKPSVVIARTLAGKGVPFLEGQLSHNLKLPAEVAQRALAELAEAV